MVIITAPLPVVLCGCESWSIKLMDERRLCFRTVCLGEYVDVKEMK